MAAHSGSPRAREITLTHEDLLATQPLRLARLIGNPGRHDLLLVADFSLPLFVWSLAAVEAHLTGEDTTVTVPEDVARRFLVRTFGSFRARVVDARRRTIRVTSGVDKTVDVTIRGRLLGKGRVLTTVRRRWGE
jgi:hypothetical protein